MWRLCTDTEVVGCVLGPTHSRLRPSCRPWARTRRTVQHFSCWSCCLFLSDQPTRNIYMLKIHLLVPHGNVQCLLSFQGIVLPSCACAMRQRQSYSIPCGPLPPSAGGVHRATVPLHPWGCSGAHQRKLLMVLTELDQAQVA